MTEMTKSMAVFTGSVNPSLADQVATELGTTLGNVKLEKFANGEIYARYLDSVRGADVFIIQSIAGEHINDALMEMLIMIDAAKRASPLLASPSRQSSLPTSSPLPAPMTSSPSICIRTQFRASSTFR